MVASKVPRCPWPPLQPHFPEIQFRRHRACSLTAQPLPPVLFPHTAPHSFAFRVHPLAVCAPPETPSLRRPLVVTLLTQHLLPTLSLQCFLYLGTDPACVCRFIVSLKTVSYTMAETRTHKCILVFCDLSTLEFLA